MELGPTQPVKSGGDPRPQGEDKKLRKISQEFEAIFLSFLMKSMRRSVPEGGLLPQGAGHDLYRQIFDEEIARSLAKSKGIGLADVIYRELNVHYRQKLPPAHEQGQGIPLRGLSPRDEGR